MRGNIGTFLYHASCIALSILKLRRNGCCALQQERGSESEDRKTHMIHHSPAQHRSPETKTTKSFACFKLSSSVPSHAFVLLANVLAEFSWRPTKEGCCLGCCVRLQPGYHLLGVRGHVPRRCDYGGQRPGRIWELLYRHVCGYIRRLWGGTGATIDLPPAPNRVKTPSKTGSMQKQNMLSVLSLSLPSFPHRRRPR